MKKRLEMIGNKFGRLTVLEIVGELVSGRHPKLKCICECGTVCVKTSVSLKTGRNPSCGCATRDFQREKNDLTGKRFGRLTVIAPEELSNSKRHIVWKCVCDCGKETKSVGSDLRSGNKKSCGCLHRDVVVKTSTKHGHAKSNKFSLTYVSWVSMHTRCKNKNSINFKNYGGRGISVCERWFLFENFLSDMGERPSKDYSIDRIDVNGNYEPSNCRWATKSEQNKNQRRYKIEK